MRKRSVLHATCDRRLVPLPSGIYLAFVLSLIPYRGDPYPQELEVVLSALPESGSKDPETNLFNSMRQLIWQLIWQGVK